jgi:hypothetical protein
MLNYRTGYSDLLYVSLCLLFLHTYAHTHNPPFPARLSKSGRATATPTSNLTNGLLSCLSSSHLKHLSFPFSRYSHARFSHRIFFYHSILTLCNHGYRSETLVLSRGKQVRTPYVPAFFPSFHSLDFLEQIANSTFNVGNGLPLLLIHRPLSSRRCRSGEGSEAMGLLSLVHFMFFICFNFSIFNCSDHDSQSQASRLGSSFDK